MRMFDRLPREESEEVLAWTTPPGEVDDATVQQAIDTVARRVFVARAQVEDMFTWEDFPDVGENDWERIEQRTSQLIKEVDAGQEPYKAAYELLKARATR